jgi:type IV pilus assembly protein PilN
MVRVNLLPERRQAARRMTSGTDVSQLWVLFVAGAMVLTVVACLFIQKIRQDELDAILRDNNNTQGQIDAIKKQIANHDEIKARLKDAPDRRRRSSSSRTCSLRAAGPRPTATSSSR